MLILPGNGGAPSSDLSPLGTQAVAYATLGYTVMPGNPNSNTPHRMLGSGWHYCSCGQAVPLIGSNDPATVADWWHRDPHANVLVITGQRSRLLDLDVDTHKANGHLEFHAWVEEHRSRGEHLPDHPTYMTPSGGRHHWFALPEGLHVKTNGLWLMNAEAKLCGGEVAVPPSTRLVEEMMLGLDDQPAWGMDVRSYEWDHMVELPLAPDWLLADVQTTRTKRTAAYGQAGGRSNGSLPDTEWLLQHGFSPGSRDQDCYALACRLWRGHWGNDEGVIYLIHKVWERTDQPPDMDPFTWQDAMKKVSDARRWVSERMKEDTSISWPNGGIL